MFSSSSTFQRESVLKRSPDFVFRKNPDGSIILLDVTDDVKFFKITGVAAKIFDLLDDKSTLGSILDTVSAQHDVTNDRLYKDAEEFLLKLKTFKIIE